MFVWVFKKAFIFGSDYDYQAQFSIIEQKMNVKKIHGINVDSRMSSLL